MPEAQRSIAVVMLHGGCNMVCDFCAAECGLEAFSRDAALRLMGRLRARGFKGVVLGGGEPFTWPHLLEITAEAKARGLHVQVGTNGVPLPRDFATLPHIDRYVLPLESAQPEPHDRVRHMAGRSHHGLILERLDALRHARRPVTVSTVVTAETLEELPALGQWLSSYVADGGLLHAWHLYRFIPMGRGGALSIDRFEVSEAAYHAATNAQKAAQPHLTIFKRPDMYHSREVDFFWMEGGRLRTGSAEWAARES